MSNSESGTQTGIAAPPLTIEPYSGGQTATDRRSTKLTYTVEGGDKRIHGLLKDMRAGSGLSLRALAERMGIQRGSLNQYFWQRRNAGSSRLSWFLRFAEACGYTVWLTSPALKDQIELKAKYYRPPGNPLFHKSPPE